jgi:hypothetical protein
MRKIGAFASLFLDPMRYEYMDAAPTPVEDADELELLQPRIARAS